MSEKTADLIANGREYGEKNGWWRGGLRGPNGKQACARGWLLFGNGYTEDCWYDVSPGLLQAEKAIMRVVAKEYGVRYLNTQVIGWNDDTLFGPPNRQAVLDVFEKAEKVERAGFDPDEGIEL